MSAYIVDRHHIDFLVRSAVKVEWLDRSPFRFWHDGDMIEVGRQNATDFGRMLWAENVKSVAYRYPRDTVSELPGPRPFDANTVRNYMWRENDRLMGWSCIAALKAIDGYEYQSCEHPEWEGSLAQGFCQALRKRLIGHLPGYDECPWEITSDSIIAYA